MDYVLVITVLILVSLGVVMVLSASAPSALSKTGSSYTYFIKQFGFAVFWNNSNAICFKNRLSIL